MAHSAQVAKSARLPVTFEYVCPNAATASLSECVGVTKARAGVW